MAVTKHISTTTTIGEGFITHEEQEEQGLSFEVLCQKDGITYIRVSGEETNVNTWVIRVLGVEVTEIYIQSIIDSLPLSSEQLMNNRIIDLETRLAIAQEDNINTMLALTEVYEMILGGF